MERTHCQRTVHLDAIDEIGYAGDITEISLKIGFSGWMLAFGHLQRHGVVIRQECASYRRRLPAADTLACQMQRH